MSAAATTRHYTSWMVATAIAAVEARWNYPLRLFNKDVVKPRLRAIAVTSRTTPSSSSSDVVRDNTRPMTKSEASMERVMGLSCFGPTTVRF